MLRLTIFASTKENSIAFTKTPIQSTEQNTSINLIYPWDSRKDSTDGYDTKFKNVLFEPLGDNNFQLLKRDGVELDVLIPAPSGPVLGIYYWQRQPGTVVLAIVFIDNLGVPSITFYNPLTGLPVVGPLVLPAGANKGDDDVFFKEFLYQNGTTDLIVTTVGGMVKFDSATLTLTSIPTGPKGSIEYLDGYLFGIDSTNSNIVNSNLNDPTTWSASNFLAVDSYPDTFTRLARVGPYLVALGYESIQYFFDAANPTGTPLSAVVGATKRVGYLGGLTHIGDDLLFIGISHQAVPSLYRLSGLRLEPLVSAPFARFWSTQGNFRSTLVPAPDGSLLNLNGHTVYYVRTPSVPFPVGGVPPATIEGESYLYDLDSKVWTNIEYQSSGSFLIKSAATYFPGAAFPTGNPRRTYFILLGSSLLRKFNPNLGDDMGQPYTVMFRTQPQDFGTLRTKFGGRLVIDSDQAQLATPCAISWSDDDYQTTSTPRNVPLNNTYKQLYGLGSFRRRSFTLTYSGSEPMRWRRIELDYDQGSA